MKSIALRLVVLAALATGCTAAVSGPASQAAVAPMATTSATASTTPTPTPMPTSTPTPTPAATPVAFLGCTLLWTFSNDGSTVLVDFPRTSQPSCETMIPGSAAIVVSRSAVGPSGAQACHGNWASEPIVVYSGTGVAVEALCGIVNPRVAYTIKGTQSHGNTKRFTLRTGSYKVTITGKATHEAYGFGGGNVIVYLADSQGEELLFNEIVGDGKTFKFATHQYDLVGEAYHLDLTMPSGTWSVTFTPED